MLLFCSVIVNRNWIELKKVFFLIIIIIIDIICYLFIIFLFFLGGGFVEILTLYLNIGTFLLIAKPLGRGLMTWGTQWICSLEYLFFGRVVIGWET